MLMMITDRPVKKVYIDVWFHALEQSLDRRKIVFLDCGLVKTARLQRVRYHLKAISIKIEDCSQTAQIMYCLRLSRPELKVAPFNPWRRLGQNLIRLLMFEDF